LRSAATCGVENAGDVAVINRKLKFTPWTISPEDAQFLGSRTFAIDEIGRWYGVPPHLLGQVDKTTSWGQGIAEQNRGLARYTLTPWTTRIEQRLSRLIAGSKHVEFDFTAFIAPSPEDEISLLLSQVNGGLITANEARRIRNMPPIEGGDTLRTPAGAAPAPAPTEGKAA
jgi:HK97 family phage portal protein